MFSLRISFYLFISTICLCLAHPSQDVRVHSSLSPITENYDTEEYLNRGIQQGRQNSLLTTVGSALAPIVGTLFAPIISQLASAITNAIIGKLPGANTLNGTNSYNYDAYLIDMPNSPGPYLFLTNPKADNINNNNNNNDKQNTEIPSLMQFSQPETSPSVQSSQSSSTTSSSHIPNLGLKQTLIKQYIGTVKIKSNQELSDESNSDKITELRVLDAPSHGFHYNDVIVRRERQTKE